MTNMKYNISLNFLSLSNSDFTFTIYRRKVEHQEKRWDKSIHHYRLIGSDDKYTSYWISFDVFEDSEQYDCPSRENNELTKQYISVLLNAKIVEQGLNLHSKTDGFNKRRVYIILDKIKDAYRKVIGDKTIWLEPYILKTTNQFGVLIDYGFIKSKNYPFNREVQKFSLSLNSDYRTNVNYNIDKYQIIQKFIKNDFSKIHSLLESIQISNSFIEIESNTLDLKQYISIIIKRMLHI